MRRIASSVAAVATAALVVGVFAATPASAQPSIGLYVGGFQARGANVRANSDVLLNNTDFLDFNISDFNGPTFGGEFLVGLANNFEAGLGVGFQTRTVPTVYANFVHANGTKIE